MYLLKCDCGAIFTVKQLSNRCLTCPDCDKPIILTAQSDQQEIMNVCNSTGLKVQIIPDEAEITVTFRA